MTTDQDARSRNSSQEDSPESTTPSRSRRRSILSPLILGFLLVLVVLLAYVLFQTLAESKPDSPVAPVAPDPIQADPAPSDAFVDGANLETANLDEALDDEVAAPTKTRGKRKSSRRSGDGEAPDLDETDGETHDGAEGEASVADPLFWEVFREEKSATQFDPALLTVEKLEQLRETLTRWRERLDQLDANSAENLGEYLTQASAELESEAFADALQTEDSRRVWRDSVELIRTLRDDLAARGVLRLDAAGCLAEPFDRETTVIPPGFRGHSAEQVVAALESSSAFNVARKTGESDRAYDERLEEIRQEASERTLFGTVKYGSTLAFVVAGAERRLGAGFDVVESYYAVGKKQCELRKLDFANDFNMFSAEFYQAHRDEISPIRFLPGTIDFPTTRPFALKYDASFPSVAKGELKLYGLAIEVDRIKRSRRNDPARLKRALSQTNLVWRVTNLPPEKGKELDRYGRVLCLCRLSPESVNETYATTKTVETRVVGRNAYQYRQTDYALRVCDVEFWVYSALTGEIFAKYTAKEAYEGKRKVYLGADDAPDDSDDGEGEAEASESRLEAAEITRESLLADYAPDESLSLVAPTIVAERGKSFAETLAKASEGGVVGLDAGATFDAGKEAVVDKPLVVVGTRSESGGLGTVVVGFNEPITISAKVVFKNARFVRERSSGSIGKSEPTIKVLPGGDATFLDCEFDGDDGADSIGVWVDGEGAKATFRGCLTSRFARYGIAATNGGRVDVEFCEFESNDGAAVAGLDGGRATVKRSYFTGNRASFAASGGGGGEVDGSLFEKNILNFSLSPGSKDACRIGDDNTARR